MTKIHPTAIIADGAQIHESVEIGPYCVIGKNVKIGKNSVLKSHICMDSIIEIGENNIFFPFSSLQIPQDKKYTGEESRITIGDNNIFREYSTVNSGTKGGTMETIIGNNCLFMVSAHVAHDCILGDNIILANAVALAGHVVLEDFVIIGGLSAVHQFVRIGKHAMVGGMSAVVKDVIPYGVVTGDRAFLNGLNIIGLKRRGFTNSEIGELRSAYDKIFNNENNTTFQKRLKETEEEFSDNDTIMDLINFIQTDSTRSFCQPKVSA